MGCEKSSMGSMPSVLREAFQESLDMAILAAESETKLVEGGVDVEAFFDVLELPVAHGVVFVFVMLFAVPMEDEAEFGEFFVNALDVALAESHQAVTADLVAKKADIAVAVAVAVAPEEGVVGLDVPEVVT